MRSPYPCQSIDLIRLLDEQCLGLLCRVRMIRTGIDLELPELAPTKDIPADIADEHLSELAELADTAGARVVDDVAFPADVACPAAGVPCAPARPRPAASTPAAMPT